MTSLSEDYDYVIGVDTHARNHMYAIVRTGTGELVCEPCEFRNTADGHLAALRWISNHTGDRSRWLAAIEGAGSYGKKVRENFTISQIAVTEVPAAKKGARRGKGKNDVIDAINAARAALARRKEELAQPRQGQTRDVLQVLLTVRTQDNRERTSRINALNALVRTCGLLRDTRKKLSAAQIRAIAVGGLELDGHPSIVASARSFAARVVELNRQIRANEKALRETITAWLPEVLAVPGAGPVTAARALCAWSHPGRFPTEAHFASLAGIAPIQIGSGGSFSHRLNYGGDRQLNSAIHTVMLTRIRIDQRTQDYIARRTKDGMPKRKIQRVLKRYICREIFHVLERSEAAEAMRAQAAVATGAATAA